MSEFKVGDIVEFVGFPAKTKAREPSLQYDTERMNEYIGAIGTVYRNNLMPGWVCINWDSSTTFTYQDDECYNVWNVAKEAVRLVDPATLGDRKYLKLLRKIQYLDQRYSERKLSHGF